MADLIHHWQRGGRTITFSWLDEQTVVLDRVYALAFTQNGQMLLVGKRPNPDYWLPGGGVEPGESAEVALARELLEEAAATTERLSYLGAQRVDDPLKGLLVPPERFLDTIFWGRTDPKAALLLDKALRADRTAQPPAEPTPEQPSE